MTRIRWFLTVTFVLAVVGALLYGSYQVLLDTHIPVPSLLKTTPGSRILISMEGFRMVQSEGGRPAWGVTARSADLFESKEARLRDVEIVFNNEDGKTAALIGEQGTMDTETGNATIRRGTREVRIVTSDGYLMTTDSLAWKASDRVIRTADPFKVLGKEIYIEGTGMSANVDMRKVVVNSNVKAVLQE